VLLWTLVLYTGMKDVGFDRARSNGLPISRRKRATTTVKKPMISRAKRSTAWAC
jgi:hypothetical protein